MKKLFLLPLLALGLMVGGLSIKAPIQAVHAEETQEVVVTEETYTCTEGDETMYLTLKSDFTGSITYGEDTIDFTYTREGDIVSIILNGEMIQVQLNLENHTFGEPELNISEENEESVSDKISNFKNTYLVPLLSGVSLFSILSFAMSIIGFISNRNYKRDRSSAEDNVLTKVLDLMGLFTKLLTEISNTNTLSKDTKAAFELAVKEFTKSLDELKSVPAKVDKVAKCEVGLAQVLSKIAANDPKLISCGIAEDCQVRRY